MSAAAGTHSSVPERPRTRRARSTWIGASALVMAAAVVAAPYFVGRWRQKDAHAGPSRAATVAAAAEETQNEASRAASALASLTTALSALNDVHTKATQSEAPIEPPRPEDFPSATACMRTYLPEIDVADSSLDDLCEETDAWAAERALYARLSHRRGGEAWTRLGRHTMLAVAMMRSGCCVAPKPLTAVLPGLWCGVLRDELEGVGPAPDATKVKSYESMMRCLDARGTHLPERWKSRPEWITDRAFAALLDVARRRERR